MSDKINFLKELKALLKKYNASISFAGSECSDWRGIYEARIEAQIGDDFDNEIFVLSEGYSLIDSDIN